MAGESGRPLGARMRIVVVGSALVVLGFFLAPPLAILDKADVIGSAVCHQLPERSFVCAGRPLPLCARCTGTFVGALVGVLGMVALGRSRARNVPPLGILIVLVLFVIVFAIDGLNSFVTFFPALPCLYEPNDLLRVWSGTLNGLALSIITWPILNFTLWADGGEQRSVVTIWELGGLVVAAFLVAWGIQTEAGFLLYPAAMASALGVLVMLTMVNTVIVAIVLRQESVATTWREAAPLFLAGLAAVCVEISALHLFHVLVMGKLGV